MGLLIRAAGPTDRDRLRELTFESKAHWGYEPDLVRRWADGLTFEAGDDRWVAEADGRVVAWVGLSPPHEGVAILDDLWVDPQWIGRGIGTRLFRVAADRARRLGAARLEWDAEPHALGFYEQLGGRFLREHVTEWGRPGSWYGIDL